MPKIPQVPINSDGSISVAEGFGIPAYDYQGITYVSGGAADGEIETITFKTGGSGGTTVATLTLGYTGANLTSVTKS